MGLYLKVSPGGGKAWVLRYVIDGRERFMGLGSAGAFNVKAARERARAARRQLADGVDPIQAKQEARGAARAAAAKRITFEQAAAAYASAHEVKWKNRRHREQFLFSLRNDAFPIIGDLEVSVVDTPAVLRVVEPIWQQKTETARRVLRRIEAVLAWCTVRGQRSGDNPARWKGHLKEVLPARGDVAPVKHFAALPYVDAPAFMAELREVDGVAARALEILVYTATRTAEVLGARWDELDGSTWTIPASRMKTGVEHRVPLSAPALGVLKALPRAGELVFAGERGQLGEMAMLNVLQRLRPDTTVHGLRSSFRTWAAERTSYPRDIAERALAHKVGSKVEQAYERTDLLEKRARLMQDWGRYCSTPAGGGKVVPLRGRR
jgi:integrase